MDLFRKIGRRAVNLIGRICIRASLAMDNACTWFSKPNDHRVDLLVLDDFFPDVLSAFRIAEFNYYLEKIPSEVHSARPSNLFYRCRGSYEEKLHEYSCYYPDLSGRVKTFNKLKVPNCRLACTVFINNTFNFIEYFDKHKIPFVFTLYPGGGFYIDEAVSDMKLQRVLSSPNFRKVIVTQKITQEYLLAKNYCNAEDICFAYGAVLPSQALSAVQINKRRFKVDKNTLDICFVAAKYTDRGIDKGYDVFIDVAKKLHQIYPDIKFHIVGSFDASDIDVFPIKDRITFYGLRNTDFFPGFYSGMDIVLSPNVPFVLAPGAFDGFPTGACTEAGLCGVAVLCSDPLKQNISFKDGEEIVIIPRESREIVKIITHFYENPEVMYRIAEDGKRAFTRVFDLDAQMSVRMKVIEQLLQQDGPVSV